MALAKKDGSITETLKLARQEKDTFDRDLKAAKAEMKRFREMVESRADMDDNFKVRFVFARASCNLDVLSKIMLILCVLQWCFLVNVCFASWEDFLAHVPSRSCHRTVCSSHGVITFGSTDRLQHITAPGRGCLVDPCLFVVFVFVFSWLVLARCRAFHKQLFLSCANGVWWKGALRALSFMRHEDTPTNEHVERACLLSRVVVSATQDLYRTLLPISAETPVRSSRCQDQCYGFVKC